ncbi:F-box/kelch-repeat protein OR23-like [Panicum miliaceum]|uniref:F-box/kelch-repeat protein OR23-like n=1 Tax=Panicum miliaceum TaxID=4540 RepID=A0A3L6QH75_PANMI|nr:F-box/kelch-repeat protein OR23-like [Panicum miliaceum]
MLKHEELYAFATNRWLREATTRRIPNTESCGFVSMNGELYVLRSAKVPVEASGPWRQLKKKLALEFQGLIYKTSGSSMAAVQEVAAGQNCRDLEHERGRGAGE